MNSLINTSTRPKVQSLKVTTAIMTIVAVCGVCYFIFTLVPVEFHSLAVLQGQAPSSLLRTAISCPPFRHNLTSPSLPQGWLPGYTGWVRKMSTQLQYFQMAFAPTTNDPRRSGRSNLHIRSPLEVQEPLCHDLNTQGQQWSIFLYNDNYFDEKRLPAIYARAYGPAILVGRTRPPVLPLSNGIFKRNKPVLEIVFTFRTPGPYSVEVILEQEETPDLKTYPTAGATLEYSPPPYMGWSLTMKPLSLTVTDSFSSPPPSSFEIRIADKNSTFNDMTMNETKKEAQFCTLEQLSQEDAGEWVVTEREGQLNLPLSSKIYENVNELQNYVLERERSGFLTEWVHQDKCSILPELVFDANKLPKYMRALDVCANDENIEELQLILIGDSTMRMTMDSLKHKLQVENSGRIHVHYWTTHDGLHTKLRTTREGLEQIRKRSGKHVIVFNAGLHEIRVLCQNLDTSVKKGENCLDLYTKYFTELVDLVGNYGADALIYRSTTAGWMRWGNYGFAWPARLYQMLLLSPHAVKQVNKEAIDIVKNSKFDIEILDYFWLTYPRPDSTQVEVHSNDNMGQHTGAHLVHPGIAVNDVFTRKVLMTIMWKICPKTIDRWYFP